MENTEVIILSSGSDKIDSLKSLFHGIPTKVLHLQIPHHILKSQFSEEYYRIEEALKISNPDKNTLIIKDNVVTNTSNKNIRRIMRAVEHEKGWDLCYLSKWLDRCDIYNRTKVTQIEGVNSYIVKTYSPNGVSAIIFSVKGKKIIKGETPLPSGKYFKPNTSLSNDLKREIEKNELNALAISPNVFEYDVLLATSVSDLAKLSECRRPSKSDEINQTSWNHPFLWFLLVIFLTIIFLWAIYHLNDNKKMKTNRDLKG